MSINYEFKTNIQYKYDCKLVSLTVKEGCKSNTYDKETGCFDRIAPGEYYSGEINDRTKKMFKLMQDII